MLRAAACLTVVAFLPLGTPLSARAQGVATEPPRPLAPLTPLAGGVWTAQGDGFRSALAFRWAIPGLVLEASNDITDDHGRVLAQYRGAYTWDPEAEAIVFWNTATGGELHRGMARWDAGLLWHEARVAGGAIERYTSVVRLAEDRLEYFADYGASEATPRLLSTEPLVYRRSAGGSLHVPLDTDSVTPALEVVLEQFESFNRHDAAALARNVADDFSWYTLRGDSLVAEVRGRAAFLAGMIEYFRAFPDVRSALESVTALGGLVAFRERLSWTGPDGRTRAAASLGVYEVEAGRIRRAWYFPRIDPSP